jgi:hypothetical protein
VRDGHVPLHIHRQQNGTLTMVAFQDASHVLIDRIADVKFDGLCTYDYYGTVVDALFVAGTDGTYIYFCVRQDCVPTTRMILAALSRHYLDDFSGYYNDWCSVDSMFMPEKEKETKMVMEAIAKANEKNKLANSGGASGVLVSLWHHSPESIKNLPIAKVSGEHHIHFTAAEVWAALDDGQRAHAKAAFRLPADVTTTFMAGMLLWLASLPVDLYDQIVALPLLDVPDVTTYIKVAKHLSVRAKSFQNLLSRDLRMVFEAEVLANRAYGVVDWDAEKEHRIHPNVADLSPEDIEREAMRVLSREDADAEEPLKMTWNEFWAARWQWSAAGSIHSQYEEDLKNLPAEHSLRTKFIALLAAEDVPMSTYLDRPPALHAWASTKYEWAKMRAIYGTDLTSYILTHFAFMNCEDTLPKDFPVGKKAEMHIVAARVAATLQNAVAFTLDYEDFNSQHSTAALQAVMRAWVRVHKRQLSDDQIAAADWAIQSLEHVTVTDNLGTHTTYEAKGTLMSGWRLTSFANSVLNYIYTRAAYGVTKTIRRSVHNGDDVLLGVSSFGTTIDILRGAIQHNIRLQRSKCNYGGLAEFLRVDHVHGTGGQYIARNIATMMHSRIESKAAVKVNDVIDAMEARFGEFHERGGSLATISRLRTVYYARMAPIFNLRDDDMYTIKSAHRVVGGVSSRQDADVSHFIVHDSRQMRTALPKNLPGVVAYAKCIQGTLALNLPLATIIHHIMRATLNAVQMIVTTSAVVINRDVQRYAVYRALYKAHADVNRLPLFGKAMLTGFAFDVISRAPGMEVLKAVLASSSDPFALLQVLV